MKRRSNVALAIALFLLLGSPLGAQRQVRSDSALVGCYTLTWSEGKTPKPFFPDTVVFTLSQPKWGETGYAVQVDSLWARRTSISQYLWRHLGADSILVLKTDGHNGVALELVPTSTGFRGIATAFRDVIDRFIHSRHGKLKPGVPTLGRRAAA